MQFFDQTNYVMPKRYVPREVTYNYREKIEREDDQLRGILLKPPQIIIFLQQLVLKPFRFYRLRFTSPIISVCYIRNLSDQIVSKWVTFNAFTTDAVAIIRADLIVMLNQLESMMEWFTRDWEDLLYPWVPFSTRYELDSKVYPYTLVIQQAIVLLGDIVLECYLLYAESKKVIIIINIGC